MMRFWPRCHACDMITSCAPALEACLGFISFSIGLGIFLHPGIMAGSRALVELLYYMPEMAWSAVFIAVALAKFAALLLNRQWIRHVGLAAGVALYSHLAGVAIGQEVAVLAPWVYGPLAIINVVTWAFVAWDAGRKPDGN